MIVLDQSGSMTDVIHSIRDGCLALERSAGAKTAVHYIVFNEKAKSSEVLQALPFESGGTRISSAFQELHCLIRRHGAPRKVRARRLFWQLWCVAAGRESPRTDRAARAVGRSWTWCSFRTGRTRTCKSANRAWRP